MHGFANHSIHGSNNNFFLWKTCHVQFPVLFKNKDLLVSLDYITKSLSLMSGCYKAKFWMILHTQSKLHNNNATGFDFRDLWVCHTCHILPYPNFLQVFLYYFMRRYVKSLQVITLTYDWGFKIDHNTGGKTILILLSPVILPVLILWTQSAVYFAFS